MQTKHLNVVHDRVCFPLFICFGSLLLLLSLAFIIVDDCCNLYHEYCHMVRIFEILVYVDAALWVLSVIVGEVVAILHKFAK